MKVSTVLLMATLASLTSAQVVKQRYIVTTDLGADVDDQQSMVRLLVQSNEVDIRGLVVTTSCWKQSQSSTSMLNPLLDAYAQAYNNLKTHASGYPTPDFLRSVSVLGQKGYSMGDVGSGRDSPGSNLIISEVDKADTSRPVWIGGWGGLNTAAQALWKVQNTRSANDVNTFISKMRIYDILGQDEAGAWIAKNFPNLVLIRSVAVYGWAPSDGWVSSNVQNKGPLGAQYPNRVWATEGDSPAFLHVIANGLNNPDKIDQGGWGGRFSLNKKANIRGMEPVKGEGAYDTYMMYTDSSEGASSISKWIDGINNDFAARMIWATTSSFSGANHHPVAVVNGDKTRNVLEIRAPAGSNVVLDGSGSSDPDGNSLNFNWQFYKEPSSYSGSVSIQGANSNKATVTVPSNAGTGSTIHIVLVLKDNASLSLTSYRRVIITVGTGGPVPTTTTTTTRPTTTTTTTRPTTTTTTRTTTTTATSPTPGGGSNCSAKWGQCGGQGWTGPTCCQSGSTCNKLNDYYFQCV